MDNIVGTALLKAVEVARTCAKNDTYGGSFHVGRPTDGPRFVETTPGRRLTAAGPGFLWGRQSL